MHILTSTVKVQRADRKVLLAKINIDDQFHRTATQSFLPYSLVQAGEKLQVLGIISVFYIAIVICCVLKMQPCDSEAEALAGSLGVGYEGKGCFFIVVHRQGCSEKS